MKEKELYSIGEVSKICNISKKALRFYDQIGIFRPDVVTKGTGYRYYSRHQLLCVPVLKYFKQLGFKLEEMHGLIEGNNYSFIKEVFTQKIEELKHQQKIIHNSYRAVKDWYELIQEAQMVIRGNVQEISVRYQGIAKCCFLEQNFDYQYMDSIINIPWVNHLEQIHTEITGPVILEFPSALDKMNGNCSRAKIIQEILYPSDDAGFEMEFGGFLAASLYHIGPMETISEDYERMFRWLGSRGYQCNGNSYERYVVDYWTTRNPEEFVTELIVPVQRV